MENEYSLIPLLTGQGIDEAVFLLQQILHEKTWEQRSSVLNAALEEVDSQRFILSSDFLDDILATFEYPASFVDELVELIGKEMVKISESAAIQYSSVLVSNPIDQTRISLIDPFSFFSGNSSGRFLIERDRLVQQMVSSRFSAKRTGNISSDKELAKSLLEKAFGEKSNDRYWMVASFNWAAKARNYGIAWYFDFLGIKECVFDAVLDHRTTVVCRWAHGKIVRVSSALESLNSFISDKFSSFFEEKVGDDGLTRIYAFDSNGGSYVVATQKELLSMIPDSDYELPINDLFEQKISDYELSGILIPPLHHLCRSILLPAS